MDNPCENCLVKPCCKILRSPYIYKCGCDKYEIYYQLKMLDQYGKNSFAALNIIARLKDLGVNP